MNHGQDYTSQDHFPIRIYSNVHGTRFYRWFMTMIVDHSSNEKWPDATVSHSPRPRIAVAAMGLWVGFEPERLEFRGVQVSGHLREKLHKRAVVNCKLTALTICKAPFAFQPPFSLQVCSATILCSSLALASRGRWTEEPSACPEGGAQVGRWHTLTIGSIGSIGWWGHLLKQFVLKRVRLVLTCVVGPPQSVLHKKANEIGGILSAPKMQRFMLQN